MHECMLGTVENIELLPRSDLAEVCLLVSA